MRHAVPLTSRPASFRVRRLPSDISRYLRSSLADRVSDVGVRVDHVEDALRGPDGEGGGEVSARDTNGQEKKEKDFVEPKEALQEAGKGVEAVLEGVQTGKGKEKEDSEEKNTEDAVQDEAITRLARLIDTLQSDEQYQRAVRTLLAVTGKYLNLLDEVREDVSTSLQKAEGEDGVEKVQSLAADGVEKVGEEVRATVASTHLEAQVSTKVSHHLVEAFRAAVEVVEGLAGGRSMSEVVEKMDRIKADVEKDSGLREWLRDVNDFLSSTIAGKDGTPATEMDTETVKRELQSLYGRLQELLHSRPDILAAIEDLKASVRAVVADIQGDVALHRIRARTRRIVQLATMGLWEGAKDVKSKGSQILSLLVNAVIPSVADILGSVPIPRVEFTSDNIDAVVEDVVIPVVSLIPDTIKVTTMNDWEWKRNPGRKTTHSKLDTNLQIGMRGLQVAVSDISFYVQERFTAPSPAACFSCCSFGQSQSSWCFFRGPSSWLAYTESALLDVGFWRKGLGITLDVSDAGQTEEDTSSKKTKGKRNDVMWDDDTTTEGKRTHFFHVSNVDVQVDDSFDFKLRESRHWIINGLLRIASKPLIKIVMRRIISAQVQHAFEMVDARAWDAHYRAKRLSLLRDERNAKWEKQGLPTLERKDIHPTMWDYLTVVMDASAGKSAARLRKEEIAAEEEAARKKRQEEEAQEAQENDEERRLQSQQPGPTKTMEIKPTSIIKHDVDGNYSLSIGLAPRLLDESKSGPKTRHIRLRDDLVQRNYKNLADRPKQKVLNVYDEADIQGTVTSVAGEVQRGADLVGDVVQGTLATSRVVADNDEQAADDDDDGWKSAAFDL